MMSTIEIPHWEHFPHGADVGIRGVGKTLEEAFEMASQALTAVVSVPEKVSPAIGIEINCSEKDLDLLFFDWLNALIYEMDARQMVFSDYQIRIQDGALHAKIKGEKINPTKHDPAVDVKGATMTELKVSRADDSWIAQCVVDV